MNKFVLIIDYIWYKGAIKKLHCSRRPLSVLNKSKTKNNTSNKHQENVPKITRPRFFKAVLITKFDLSFKLRESKQEKIKSGRELKNFLLKDCCLKNNNKSANDMDAEQIGSANFSYKNIVERVLKSNSS